MSSQSAAKKPRARKSERFQIGRHRRTQAVAAVERTDKALTLLRDNPKSAADKIAAAEKAHAEALAHLELVTRENFESAVREKMATIGNASEELVRLAQRRFNVGIIEESHKTEILETLQEHHGAIIAVLDAAISSKRALSFKQRKLNFANGAHAAR